MSLYDRIAQLYDPWSASVVEDIEFYVEEARRAGGPVVELAVGTGRIALPMAARGDRGDRRGFLRRDAEVARKAAVRGGRRGRPAAAATCASRRSTGRFRW